MSVPGGRVLAPYGGSDRRKPSCGFAVFAPLAFEPEDAQVDVGEDLPIMVAGMYPTHALEREFIAEHGLEAFWKLDWDPYDVTRPSAV